MRWAFDTNMSTSQIIAYLYTIYRPILTPFKQSEHSGPVLLPAQVELNPPLQTFGKIHEYISELTRTVDRQYPGSTVIVVASVPEQLCSYEIKLIPDCVQFPPSGQASQYREETSVLSRSSLRRYFGGHKQSVLNALGTLSNGQVAQTALPGLLETELPEHSEQVVALSFE